MYIWGKASQVEEITYTYGPDAGVCLACLSYGEEASVAGVVGPTSLLLGFCSLVQTLQPQIMPTCLGVSGHSPVPPDWLAFLSS